MVEGGKLIDKTIERELFDMQHISSPSYISYHNSHNSGIYFYYTNAKTVLRVSIKTYEILDELVCCGFSIEFIVGGFGHRTC